MAINLRYCKYNQHIIFKIIPSRVCGITCCRVGVGKLYSGAGEAERMGLSGLNCFSGLNEEGGDCLSTGMLLLIGGKALGVAMDNDDRSSSVGRSSDSSITGRGGMESWGGGGGREIIGVGDGDNNWG